MFRIGEFSRIAGVSGRLLRYYDQIGLLKPSYTEQSTGYRYYNAAQLPRLNRILALQELGLSLEQIARMLQDQISAEEIRGMLLLRRVEVKQTLTDEAARLAQIEARLQQIERDGRLPSEDVAIKSVAARQALTVRAVYPSPAEVMRRIRELLAVVPRELGERTLENFIAVVHSEVFETENIDVELGFLLARDLDRRITLADSAVVRVTTLPAITTMATVVRAGPPDRVHLATGEIGYWVEANGYRIAGPNRELFVHRPDLEHPENFVIEIQFPVEKAPETHAT